MLEITVEKPSGDRVLVSLTGRLDTTTHAQCEESLGPLLVPETRVLILDMARLEYLSSMGLRVLMRTNKVLSGQGGQCLFVNLQPPIRAVIDIANALPDETVFASVEEADRYLDIMQRRAKEATPKTTNRPR